MKTIVKAGIKISESDVIAVECKFDAVVLQAEFAHEIHYRRTESTMGTGHGGTTEEFWIVCPQCQRVLPIPREQWEVVRKYMDNITKHEPDWHG